MSRLERLEETMKVKLILSIITASLLVLLQPVQAQQPPKIPRIGYISGTGDSINQGPFVEALRQGLLKLGYVEGKHFKIEFRGAEGQNERVPGLVAELVQLNVDLLVLPVPGAIRAGKQATKTIPIIMVASVDPVETGLVDSLARPGGNITGISTLNQDLNAKRLELLKEVVPKLSRVGILFVEGRSTNINLKEYETAARNLKVQLRPIEVQDPKPDLESAFQTATKVHVGALITITTATLFLQQKRLAELAIKHRLPSMFHGSTWVESGGLMSYSTDELGAFRRAAYYVDRILKGTKPTDLPVEQPTKFEFAINLKTAKQIGLNIPQSVLFRADKVIR
jgi:putative tryptophan/tyrosine transport system substrate-binding protein